MASQDSKSVIDVSRVDAEWLAILESTEGLKLGEPVMLRLAEGAALLARVAKADPSPQARIVEAWLQNMGRTATMARCALEDVGL